VYIWLCVLRVLPLTRCALVGSVGLPSLLLEA
jgi:hypothetical protein